MKKIIISLAALAALSTTALAERHYDLRDSAEARGSFTVPGSDASSAGFGNTIVSPLYSVNALSDNQLEMRRLQEKNDSSGKG